MLCKITCLSKRPNSTANYPNWTLIPVSYTHLNILSQEKQLTDLTIQYDNEQNEFQLQFDEQRAQLLAQIKLWKDKYILETPIAGKITFTKDWAENQNIITGDRLATIVPEDSTQIIGRITIPSSGLGKVEVGQQVNVKPVSYTHLDVYKRQGRMGGASPRHRGRAFRPVRQQQRDP